MSGTSNLTANGSVDAFVLKLTQAVRAMASSRRQRFYVSQLTAILRLDRHSAGCCPVTGR